MRASRRVEHESCRERTEGLVPLLGVDSSPVEQSRDEARTAVVGPRGSVVYHINEYLYERARH